MRWDALRLAADDPAAEAAPALFERDAAARTFDTPAFRGMTFYEVHARSIINRVPESSRMPFRWTINPYRGCSHACAYCASGETPILMADGRTRPLARVRVGDAIYGTVWDGGYRRLVITNVRAHWSTVKAAYRVRLEDGTQLITSGDHRFLTSRGWKHVTGTEQGAGRRPHLTTQSRLMGVGAFAQPPKESAEYRRGYLRGMIRGDGSLGRYRYPSGDVHRFRLALTDTQAVDRTAAYLAQAGVGTAECAFFAESAARRQMAGIGTSTRHGVQSIGRLIEWPLTPTADWRKGFLAGIFDAEGGCSEGVWRVSSADAQIIDWTVESMRVLGFDTIVEDRHRPNGIGSIRLHGGLRERLRFFHATDPAITRKHAIAGAAITGDSRLGVVSIEPLGLDLELFDITTGTGDFIADGVVSHNCFARNTHTYLDMDAGQDFNSRIVVKVNAPELARRELSAPKWQHEHVAMGTNVDCYQRAEGRYRLMPGIIGALRDSGTPFSILTKGTLILRDLDLLADAAQITDVGLNVSVGFIDAELSRSVEPGTPSPQRRLDACAAITARGLQCGVLMGPVLPMLSDSPAQLEAAVRQIAAAGAARITPIVLHLRPGAREWYLRWLAEQHPELLGPYRQLYARGAYAPREYQQRIAAQVSELAARYRVGRPSPGPAPRGVRQRTPGRPAAAPAAREPAPHERPGPDRSAGPVQLPLL